MNYQIEYPMYLILVRHACRKNILLIKREENDINSSIIIRVNDKYYSFSVIISIITSLSSSMLITKTSPNYIRIIKINLDE